MKKIQVLVLVISFLACRDQDRITVSKTSSKRDSILYYHNIATTKNNSVNDKQKAINLALALVDKNDSLFPKVLQQKTLLHFTSKEYDSLRFFGKKLSINANQVRDAHYLGKYYHLFAYYFDEIVQASDSAFYYYNLSKGYFQTINNRSQVGRRLMSMGLIQKNQNDFFGSKETLTEALHYLHGENDKKFIASCYNAIGTNHRKLLNYTDAIEYYKKAIKSTPSERDKLGYKNNLAVTYLDTNNYDDAIQILQQISKNSSLKNDSSQCARILDNLVYAQWLDETNVEAKMFLEPLKLRKQNNDKRGQIASYTHLGEFYTKKNLRKAKSYFDSVIRLSHALKIPKAEKDVLKHLMRIEPLNIKIKERYVFLQDSLYEQELKVKTQFAKYKYDDQLKQESILRLEKEKAEQALEVQQERNHKVTSYFGVGSLLLLFGFSFYYFRQRSEHLKQLNKTAKIEATFETEEELSRKLHDDFGGKLNHTMLLLQNNADTSEILDVVEGLYNQSRDFSRKINDVDTGPNYKNLLLGMLGTYSKDTKLVLTGSTTLDWNNLSDLAKKTLYRVLQELMSNMQKYSKASLVNINFDQTKKILQVNYSDNGVGATKNNLNNRNGLWNTEKRIQAIGGTIIFDSEKGKGFKAEIQIPN